MEYKVGVIAGDGIGPEIVAEARKVLDRVGEKCGHIFSKLEIVLTNFSVIILGSNEPKRILLIPSTSFTAKIKDNKSSPSKSTP